MRIVWVGAGNVATQLGLGLARAGHETCQVFSRTMKSAAALASRLDCSATDSVEQIVTDADVYLFSVSDSALEELAAKVSPRVGNGLCIHTAGSMPLDVFKGHAVRYGVMYPMQTFSKERLVDFRDVPIFVEANDSAALEQTETLARSISQNVERMGTEKRRRLHLSAVFACNFVNHCYSLAAELLKEEGIPFDVMLPLTDETARKVHTLAPKDAQTGPAVRFDRNVMDKQLATLEGHPQIQHIYKVMSESIHRLSAKDKTETKI